MKNIMDIIATPASQLQLRVFPDTAADRFLAPVMLIISGVIALLGIWSVFAVVPELAKTRGEILPTGGQFHVVQSLSGGKLLEVLVKEGDLVTKGQAIAKMDQAVTQADVRQYEVQRADLDMRIERITAVISERRPDFGVEGKDYPDIAEQQIKLYISEQAFLASSLQKIGNDIAEKKSEKVSIEDQLDAAVHQVESLQSEMDLFQQAIDKNLVSKREFLEKEERLSEVTRDKKSLSGRKNIIDRQLMSLDETLKNESLKLKTEYRQKRSELVEKLAEVEQKLIQSHLAMGQNSLQSPVEGIVKSLPNSRPGAVIQAGGVVAEIVPSDQPLEVEVRVSPRDIGFVKKDQWVQVKVDAYDYSRFGAIKGQVVRVSPATFKDETTGQPYFKAYIHPSSEFVGDSERGRQIKVGMTAEADITIGHKTIFQYLLKPVFTTVDTALSER